MPKPHQPPSLTREAVLAFVAREKAAFAGDGINGKIGKREIAKAFGVKGDDRLALKLLLKELQDEGTIEKRKGGLARPGLLPPQVLADIFGRDRDGELLASPVDWDLSDGPAPRIALQIPRKPRPGIPVPGVGDRALLRVERDLEAQKGQPEYAGRVVKLLARAKTSVLGIFRADGRGGGRIVPIEKKQAMREIHVAEANKGEAEDGDLVSADLLRDDRMGLSSGRVRERLGSVNSEKAISLIAIHAHKIPNVFRPETLAAAEAAKPATMAGREDWRALALLTIDPADAKDHDDAVHAEPDLSPNNQGGHILTIAIADVAAYVRPHSALDREALVRGNSVYFPDRVVPMLPERISNDLCSLRQLEDRPAVAVRIIVAADGRKISHSFHRIMMRSVAKLSYSQAQAAIDGEPDAAAAPLLAAVLRPLYAAYSALKTARAERGPLDLDLPERKLVLNPDGTLARVIIPARLDAHRLIEEFMILANVAAAETLEAKRQGLVYRAHDAPTMEKLSNLSEFLATLGIKLAKGQVLRAAQFNGILEKVRGTPNEMLVNEVVLRSQAQAEYVAENYGHFGLNLKRYAHFTSPIRRYADLIVHRALIRALDLGADGLPDMTKAELSEIAEKISASERRAMAAERDTLDRLIATHLSEQVGAEFAGRISGVTKAGLFVKLDETGADGFVPAATLGADFYRYEETLHALIGNRSGETFRLGDNVRVKLVEAAPFAGALRFEMLSDGGQGGNRAAIAAKPFRKGRDTKPSGTARRSRSHARKQGKGR